MLRTIIKLIMIASTIGYCGTDDSQAYGKTEMSSQKEVSREDETTTHNAGSAFESTMSPGYTRNSSSNLISFFVTSTKYIPLEKDQTNFSTTDQITKFTTENIVFAATSESGLKTFSTDTATYSSADKNGNSSCQDIQAKKFDLIYWKNLTDLERSTSALGMVLPWTVDLVEWFHSYDYNFRKAVASTLNGRNFTSNSSESGRKHFIEAGDLLYVTPTPLTNGTHVSVCFVIKSKEKPQKYLKITDTQPRTITKQGTLSKEFELPSLSAFVGCPPILMVKCPIVKPGDDHVALIASISITVAIIILVVGYLHIRGQAIQVVAHARHSPNENVNDMPCTSVSNMMCHGELLNDPRYIQRGTRTTSSFHSSGEHGRNRASSRLEAQRHLPFVREEYKGRRKGNGDDTRVEVTSM